jgi:hypothetical protein
VDEHRRELAVTDPASLGARGQLHITDAAARAYADSVGLSGPNEARQELLRLLPDARNPKRTGESDLEVWRYRKRSTGVDISARVSYEGGLVVVVAVNARPVNMTSGRRR